MKRALAFQVLNTLNSKIIYLIDSDKAHASYCERRLESAGFLKLGIRIVAPEEEPRHFQTLLAIGEETQICVLGLYCSIH
jgi:hypothetical protein